MRIFHGTEDPTVLYEATKIMGAVLKNNPNAEIITLSANHNIKPYMYTPGNFLWMAEKDLDEVKAPYNVAIITLSVAIIAIGIAAVLLLAKKKRHKASAKNIKQYVDKIQKEKIIAIVRGVSREKLIPLAKAMYDGGIRLIECTYDASGAVSDEEVAAGIEILVKHFGDEMVVGAGTVLTKKQVLLTKKAGGKFIISPDTNPAVIRRTVRSDMVSIPGALTPSEIAFANRLGADFVKIFPIGAMGSDYIKDIRAPLSNVKLLAVGGVDENNMKSYFDAGAVGIGIGSGIVKKKMIDEGDYEGITALARLYTERLNG